MSLLNRLTLKTKLYILSIFILSSLVLIATFGYRNISEMKRSLDALYFGSLVPITNLNTIVNLYNNDIKERYFQTLEGHFKPSDTAHAMAKNLTRIRALWNGYTKSYKEEKELPYIAYTTRQIEKSEAFFIKVIESCYEGCQDRSISSKMVLRHVQNVQDAIDNLIRYENEVAQFERHQLLSTYDATLFRITIILIAVSFFVMGMSFLIFKSINRTQNRLKQMAQELQISNKKLENASFTDSLTRLFNRRYFNMVFDREFKRAKRSKSTLAFYMLDIDFFKQYNDTYGHLQGDQALRQVAKALKEVFKRPGDYVFRLGGEEFGVLVSETEAQMAEFMASKTINAISELEIPHASSKVHEYVTVSVGLVICAPHSDLNDETLLSEADKNLYKAKDSGRNRYVSAILQ